MLKQARNQGREVDPGDVLWASDEAPLGASIVALKLAGLEEPRSVSIPKDEWWREHR
ncbi:MAG: hypothetical protein WD960_02875 [Gemmatimonadota bacterium]